MASIAADQVDDPLMRLHLIGGPIRSDQFIGSRGERRQAMHEKSGREMLEEKPDASGIVLESDGLEIPARVNSLEFGFL